MGTKYVSPTEQERFVNMMICACSEAARAYDLPLAAMVACGVAECGYGGSDIYKITHCPFNLQRPDSYKWVHCETTRLKTCVETDANDKCVRSVWTTFCKAKGDYEFAWLSDAARIWCEWVMGWPNQTNRKNVLSWRRWPTDFTRYLPYLGFGEFNKRVQNGERFVAVVRKHGLVERCANGACYYV